MKKKLVVLMAVVLIVSSFAMTACGGPNVAGKYLLDSAETEGLTITSDQLEAFGLTDTYIELKSNGSAVIAFSGEEASAKYTVKGTTLSLTNDDEAAYNAKIDGDTITLEEEGATMYYVKK
jgi:hypothetical protein